MWKLYLQKIERETSKLSKGVARKKIHKIIKSSTLLGIEPKDDRMNNPTNYPVKKKTLVTPAAFHQSTTQPIHIFSQHLVELYFLQHSWTAFYSKMASKRKRGEVPRSLHHPSQSSIDVPLPITEDVKKLQDNRCWLCNCKAHKWVRPLEICHIYPQALGRRFNVRLPFHSIRRDGLQNRSSWIIINLAVLNFLVSMMQAI